MKSSGISRWVIVTSAGQAASVVYYLQKASVIDYLPHRYLAPWVPKYIVGSLQALFGICGNNEQVVAVR